MRRLLRLLLCASVTLTAVLINNFLLDVPLLLRRMSLHYFSPKVTVLRLPVISAWYSDRTRTDKQSAVDDEPVRRAACITANVLLTKVDAQCDKLAIELSDVIITSESRQ